MKLFVDMDQVITDFDSAVKDIGMGKVLDENRVMTGKCRTELYDAINSRGIAFWRDIGWTEDGKELWEQLKNYNPILITAVSPICLYGREGKILWISRELGSICTIICEREEKKNFASNGSILIDDDLRNVEEWRNSGGIAIHHKDCRSTIQSLARKI